MSDRADQGIYIGSERSFYRVAACQGQLHRRGKARLPQEARQVQMLKAKGPNHLELGYFLSANQRKRDLALPLPSVRRVDIWSRKVVAWDVEKFESAELAAQLVSRPCIKERVSRRRKQPLILHADNDTH